MKTTKILLRCVRWLRTSKTPNSHFQVKRKAPTAFSRFPIFLLLFCAVAYADTTPPSAPPGLWARALSRTEVDVAWQSSTDDVGVTGYLIERCSGSACTNYSQIGTATGNEYFDTSLTAGTYYKYRIRAKDAANNLSGYSTVLTAETLDASTGCD